MRTKANRIIGLLLACMLCVLPVFTAEAKDNVKLSGVAYTVDLYEAKDIFIGNHTAMRLSEGEALWLTYTVESISKDESAQHGVIVTQDRTEGYPYDTKGVLNYCYESILLEPGNTYVFKFEVTEHGFEYVAAYGNEKEEDYIVFDRAYGEVFDDLQYAGIWLGSGAVSATLSHVHCYDKDGNDLGVAVNNGNGATVYKDGAMNAEIGKQVEHSYEFQLQDAINVAISNGRYSDADVVYMEYTVEDVKENLNQAGACMSNSPTAGYPHAGEAGFLRYNQIPDKSGSFLLVPGASYLIRFERTDENYEVLVQYSTGGVNRYATFINEYGSYSKEYGYFSLWLGEDTGSKVTATFKDFKCYDEAGNNLAVQLNQENVEIIHYGGLEDYSVCAGTYYCEENHTYIRLGADQSAVKQIDMAKEQENGTYKVDGTQLTYTVGNKKEAYHYVYIKMVDEDGYEYIRLREQEAASEDGEAEEKNYVSTHLDTKSGVDTQLLVTGIVCAVLVIGTLIGGILFMRGGKKREEQTTKKNEK